MNGFKEYLYQSAQSSGFWLLLLLAYLVLGGFSAGHALIHKRDSRSALGWVVVCLSLPIIGSVLYLLLGINRIENKGKQLAKLIENTAFTDSAVDETQTFAYLKNVGARIGNRPLTGDNQWQTYRNGEQAFPAMLEALATAKQQILLSTYIFANDDTGAEFVEALKAAHERGVSIYVLIDGVGARYSVPSMVKTINRCGIRCAQFLPPRWLPPQFSINLRNHRKIMVVDQQLAFTGGINVSQKHCIEHMVSKNSNGAADLHFSFKGSVVEQLSELFWQDWQVATGEVSKMLPTKAVGNGTGFCRLIADGPDGDLDKLSLLLNGVISAAQKRVTLMTPYFIPSKALVSALVSAVHRGVHVEVLIPEKSNLRYVDWASFHMVWELLQWGVEIHRKSPPFEHSKLVLIDDAYAMVGSANIDPRSLRLNFELMVEIFDERFNQEMTAFTETVKQQSEAMCLADVEDRPLWKKLRDGVFWLFSPYL